MPQRSQLLKKDPLPWLLERENPSVRYWALVDVLGRPASDPEVQQTRAALVAQPLVKRLFALQHADGSWGDDPAKPYTTEGAMGVLSLLFMLGVPPDARTRAGCESLLQFGQNANGGLSLVRTVKSGIFPCTTGEHLPMLTYFGLGDDPRVRAAFAFVVEDMATDDALDCGRYQHRPCLWGAIATLKGLAALPAEMQSVKSQRVIKRMAETLLGADYDLAGEHKRWLTFGVPRAWDMLAALRALAAHSLSHDRRFQTLLDLVLSLQDVEGRWLCGSTSRTWPIEPRNRPSKWVTLDVMRVLKVAGRLD